VDKLTKYLLTEEQLPAAWVNVLPSLKEPLAPPLNPGTGQPIGPEALAPIFPMALLEQEFSSQPEIDVPGEVLDIYRLWRPTPLYRARRLEAALKTPAHIYYKHEGVSPAGSHNFGGVGKGIDMPNQSQKALGGQPRAPYKHETQQKGVISFGVAPYLK